MRSEQRGAIRRLLMRLLPRALALLAAVMFMLPLYWALTASLRRPGLPPPRSVTWLPESPSWDNYPAAWQMGALGRYALNSLLVVAVAVPLAVLIASWAGLALARLERRHRGRLILLSILLLLVPQSALWLTRFVILRQLGLLDSLLALILLAALSSSPLFALLFYWSFRRLPPEIFDSALLDGAGALRTWRAIALPLARPTTAVVAMLSFVLTWGDSVSPLLYLRSERHYTLPVGLRTLQQLDESNWPLLLAAAMLLTAPSLVLFMFAQRCFWPTGRTPRWSQRSH